MTNKREGIRKGLTRYGDDAFSLYVRKAFIKAMGYTDDALERPLIGIANTYSGYNACHATVPQIVEAVKRGVMLAGGLPIEFPVISLHESFAFPTSTCSLWRGSPRARNLSLTASRRALTPGASGPKMTKLSTYWR